MTLQQLFKKLLKTDEDKNNFISYYVKNHHPALKSKKKKLMLSKLLDDICNYQLDKEHLDNVIFAIPIYPREQSDEHYLDIFFVENLPKTLDNDDSVLENLYYDNRYGLDFIPMIESIGYKVSDACLYAFGCDYRLLGAILYEITFFGYSLEQQNLSIIEERDYLETICNQLEDGCKFKSFDDLEIMNTVNTDKEENADEDEFDIKFCQAENTFYKAIFKNLIELEVKKQNFNKN